MLTANCLDEVERSLKEMRFTGLCSTLVGERLGRKPTDFQELDEIQRKTNFPLLFLASLVLHRRLVAEGQDRVLMCSRDACLWHLLQTKVRDMHGSGTYAVEYFYTSRIARWFPSPTVLAYTAQRVTSATTIVDLCGGGLSLANLARQLPKVPRLWLVIGYSKHLSGLASGIPFAIRRRETTAVELANFARHGMVTDILEEAPGVFVPLFSDPASVNWESQPFISSMHGAFARMLREMHRHSFVDDLTRSDAGILLQLDLALQRLDCADPLLNQYAQPHFGREEGFIRSVLNEQASVRGMPRIYK